MKAETGFLAMVKGRRYLAVVADFALAAMEEAPIVDFASVHGARAFPPSPADKTPPDIFGLAAEFAEFAV